MGSAPDADVVPEVDLPGGWAPQCGWVRPHPAVWRCPPAQPSMAWMYSPRGVFIGDSHLVVADSGNHRVLIWHGMPDCDEQPADVVLGQPDGETEGHAAGGRGPERGMHLPTGVLIHDGRLIVADAWHHRILVWNSVPETNDVAPDVILGQPDASSVSENRGGALLGDRLLLAVRHRGRRVRVLGHRHRQPPGPGVAATAFRSRVSRADVILGQPDPAAHGENRDGPAGPDSFRWPHDVTGHEDLLLVADAGDHRMLGWSPQPAGRLRGRPSHRPAGLHQRRRSGRTDRTPMTGCRFPYAVCLDPATGHLGAADTANNRILLWDSIPDGPVGRGADHVLAQPDFGSNGENRWTSVQPDTLCWPYGLSLRGDLLAVADSGNNRVMLWRRQ